MNNLVASQEDMVKALAAATQTIQQESPAGLSFLKLNKVGYWVYGEDLLDIEEDSLWAVNPASFGMGYIAWEDSKKIGESMASIYGQPVVESSLPQVATKWQRNVSMQLVCINGEDEGEQVQYGANSVGGVKEFGVLLQQVLKHLQSGKAGNKTVPVLELGVDSYQHDKYGEIFTPVFTMKKWIENTGFAAVADEEPEVEEEPEVVEPAPKRKRAAKKKAAAAPAEVVEEEEEEEEVAEDKPAPRRRRRRK